MNWFREGWLKEDHRAIGAYIGILYAYFRFRERRIYAKRHKDELTKIVSNFFTRENVSQIISIIDEIIKNFLNSDRLEELEEVEQRYYDKFKNAWLKYVDSRRLVPHLDKVLKILLSLKNKLIPIKDSTKNGSIYIMDIHRKAWI